MVFLWKYSICLSHTFIGSVQRTSQRLQLELYVDEYASLQFSNYVTTELVYLR